MIEYEEVPQTALAAIKYTCDRCQMVAERDDSEFGEFIHINEIGGYGSVFGDLLTYRLDLCQHCVLELLGEWIRIEKEKVIWDE